jgi:hypothetical protein
MRTIRTFFWHHRVKSRWRVFRDRYYYRRPWNDFSIGNSGDIFTRDILRNFYSGVQPVNASQGPRILCVGSIAHETQSGDVLCGIGCKTRNLPEVDSARIHIHGLRGPISYQIFKAAGYDVSKVRFLADPGLLIGGMVSSRSPVKGRVVFIPHYRERKEVRSIAPKSLRLIDIDASPLRLARQIQKAECVYSSSLHGIIFAHALGRPCVFVRPMTEEPLLKYEDYFLSVGLNPPSPLDSIADANFATSPNSPPTLSVSPEEIVLPSETDLKQRGILR